MISDVTDEKNSWIHLKTDIKIIYNRGEAVRSSSITFSYCIINFIK